MSDGCSFTFGFSHSSIVFSSAFDSGNCARVEALSPTEFCVWTRPDCAGTPYESNCRTWFHFFVTGVPRGTTLTIVVMNMNKQKGLYKNDYRPVVRTLPSQPEWRRTEQPVAYSAIGSGPSIQFQIRFRHRFEHAADEKTYFAFCYPHSYSECQEKLASIDQRLLGSPAAAGSNTIYYHRELLVRSKAGRRVDLLTISSMSQIHDEHQREPEFHPLLFPSKSEARARKFSGKPVVFVSSRVHPGETPASHCFNGFLDFLLRESDPRAARLRDMFVFKLVPILNPDGVALGHYRTDTLGVNLNRVYKKIRSSEASNHLCGQRVGAFPSSKRQFTLLSRFARSCIKARLLRIRQPPSLCGAPDLQCFLCSACCSK